MRVYALKLGIILIDLEQRLREILGIERQVLEREACIHGEEEWDFGFEQEGAGRQLIFGDVIFKLGYLFGAEGEDLKQGQERIQTQRMLLTEPQARVY